MNSLFIKKMTQTTTTILDDFFARMSKQSISAYEDGDVKPINLIPTTSGTLYLGSITSLQSIQELKIDYVVSLCERETHEELFKDIEETYYDIEDQYDTVNKNKMISILDVEVPKILAYLQKGKTVLVHCFAGISRSATVVIEIMSKHLDIDIISATSYVQSHRDVICPNWCFLSLIHQRYVERHT